MSKNLTLNEINAIRRENSKLRQKEIAAFVPEPVEYAPWADFRVYRAVTGNIKGLFKATQVFKDGEGKKAQWIEKQLAEGVDMFRITVVLREALQRRLEQRRK
jgi:hypothetical protein